MRSPLRWRARLSSLPPTSGGTPPTCSDSTFDVAAGANAPDKGYNGYTARVPVLDTQTLITNGEMLADCSDLRVLYYDGLAWQELPRHVLGCNTATTDIRFMLSADIPASTSDDNYYIYYGNPAPAALPAMSETNVYLWYDDASIDRSGQYTRGRVDNWHGSGWDNSLVWNPAGYYTYNTGDNFTSGYRRAIDERDVYIEAEAYITGCFNVNNTSGVLARGIINNGTLGGESSNHYYASNRGHYPGCSGPGGYSHDGDIIERSRTITSVDGPNPPAITPNQWRRQGLAAWLTGPTNLSFWDEDNTANWAALAYPDGANLQVAGTDTNNQSTGRGFAAVMTAQETARFAQRRNATLHRSGTRHDVDGGSPATRIAVTENPAHGLRPGQPGCQPKSDPGKLGRLHDYGAKLGRRQR